MKSETHFLDRTAQCQRVLEQVLTNEMRPAELVSRTLKVSVQAGLPIKCFDMLEAWALRTYSHKDSYENEKEMDEHFGLDGW